MITSYYKLWDRNYEDYEDNIIWNKMLTTEFTYGRTGSNIFASNLTRVNVHAGQAAVHD